MGSGRGRIRDGRPEPDFRLDVLVARAAELQEIEGSLAEAERLLRLEEAGAAGACPHCGSLYARGSDFCWHCGLALRA